MTVYDHTSMVLFDRNTGHRCTTGFWTPCSGAPARLRDLESVIPAIRMVVATGSLR